MSPKRKAKRLKEQNDGIIKEKPLWKPKNESVVVIQNQVAFAKRALVGINTASFQHALQSGQQTPHKIDPALHRNKMDNSLRYVGVNPVMLWAKLRWLNGSASYMQSLALFRLLMETIPSSMLNEADEKGDRPIDVASETALGVLLDLSVDEGYPIEIASTSRHSVLHRALVFYRVEFLQYLIEHDFFTQDELWWENPLKQRETAFHVVCSLLADEVPEATLKFDYLIQFIGRSINPYHACFDLNPIPAGTMAAAKLNVARTLFDEYRGVHLPFQIARAFPRLITPLVELIADYACL